MRDGRIRGRDRSKQLFDIALAWRVRHSTTTTTLKKGTFGRESCMFHVRIRILMNLGRGFGGKGGGAGEGSADWGPGWAWGAEGKRACKRAKTFECAAYRALYR